MERKRLDRKDIMTTTQEQQSGLNIWEKLPVLSGLLAAVIIPLALALIGNWYSTAVKEKDTQIRYVELAIRILSQEPSKQTENIRNWAVQVINFYSDVKIGDETKEELLREKLQTAIKSTSRPVLREYQSGSYKVKIPSDVESMWVFYQSKSAQNPSGCQRPPNADPITPKAVAERIDEFVKHASVTEDIALIFTAFSPERGWDAAASEISINDKTLKPMTPYWCNSRVNYGYELVLR